MVKNLLISLLITILVGSLLVSFYDNSIRATNVSSLFYVNEKDKKYYQMDLKTLKNTAITERQYAENKKSFVLND